ncbi:MAG: hypothetical protein VX257_11985, partial [Planctomycetota bacterium]|nr:hypothetical protein [Planctomycetota bacterium]
GNEDAEVDEYQRDNNSTAIHCVSPSPYHVSDQVCAAGVSARSPIEKPNNANEGNGFEFTKRESAGSIRYSPEIRGSWQVF